MTALLDLPAELADLPERLVNPRVLGYPGATDIDLTPILPLFNYLAVNIGDAAASHGNDTRNLNAEEIAVCAQMTEIFHGHVEDWFSYVASGTTSAMRHAVMVAHETLPRGRWGRGPVIYASNVAHRCVEKIATNLRLPFEPIPSRHHAMDLEELAALAVPRRPAVLIVTEGTTLAESIDDAARARRVLLDMGVTDVWVHSDAANLGVPLALDDDPPAGVRLDSGVPDSITVSGQKFMGTKWPSAWCAIRRDAIDAGGSPTLEYTGDRDITPEGCRAGHLALLWWWVLHTQGVEGLRRRAAYSRRLADATGEKLQAGGVLARWWPWAFSVAFPCPPQEIVDRWGLMTMACPNNPRRRIAKVCAMPGIDEDCLALFIDDMIRWGGA